jgi:hypothetical protein
MTAFGREVLLGILAALKAEPLLAAELRTLLGTGAPMSEVTEEQIFMRVPAYAARVSLGERTVWNLVTRGLPTIGRGKSRRVDVERADVWLREERDHLDDAVEQSARRSARRAAKAVT